MDMIMENEHIHRVTLDGKDIVVVGTAHVSKESADLVEKVIRDERPDAVCVELCQARYEALTQKARWEEMDIFQIIREKRAALLLTQLIMASFQKRIADRFGIIPGEEMLRAIRTAEETGAKIVLADRDIRTTMSRTWRTMSLRRRFRFLFEVLFSLFDVEDISEEDVEMLKKHDVLEMALQTFAKKMPEVKTTLIDERDRILARSIADADGGKIVAVVGAGHVKGILANLYSREDLSSLNVIPPKSRWVPVVSWGIPALIFLIIIAGFFQSGGRTSLAMIEWWVAITGLLAGLGAILVLAHPLTILSSIVAAPFTTLHPAIAAGWVAGLVEVSLRKPQVKDFIDLKEDIGTFRGFWHNKVTRILLVVAFVNLGASIGTFVAIPLMVRYLN